MLPIIDNCVLGDLFLSSSNLSKLWVTCFCPKLFNSSCLLLSISAFLVVIGVVGVVWTFNFSSIISTLFLLNSSSSGVRFWVPLSVIILLTKLLILVSCS